MDADDGSDAEGISGSMGTRRSSGLSSGTLVGSRFGRASETDSTGDAEEARCKAMRNHSITRRIAMAPTVTQRVL